MIWPSPLVAWHVSESILFYSLFSCRKTNVPPQCPPPMPTDPVYEVHGHMRPMEMPYHEVMDTGSTLSKSDTLRRHMDFRNEYTHIWERPLPLPKSAEPHPQHVWGSVGHVVRKCGACRHVGWEGSANSWHTCYGNCQEKAQYQIGRLWGIFRHCATPCDWVWKFPRHFALAFGMRLLTGITAVETDVKYQSDR